MKSTLEINDIEAVHTNILQDIHFNDACMKKISVNPLKDLACFNCILPTWYPDMMQEQSDAMEPAQESEP